MLSEDGSLLYLMCFGAGDERQLGKPGKGVKQ